MSDLMLDVGQANELKMGFRRADFTKQDVKVLSDGKLLKQIRQVLRGHATITVTRHMIDCWERPEPPEHWSYSSHGGPVTDRDWEWIPETVMLWLAEEQQTGSISGRDLQMKFKGGAKDLHLNVALYLLEHQELIPPTWRQASRSVYSPLIYFWGTICMGNEGGHYVPLIRWSYTRNAWRLDWQNLDRQWPQNHPAAVYVPPMKE